MAFEIVPAVGFRFKGFTWPHTYRLTARQERHWYPFLARYVLRGFLREVAGPPAPEGAEEVALSGRFVATTAKDGPTPGAAEPVATTAAAGPPSPRRPRALAATRA